MKQAVVWIRLWCEAGCGCSSETEQLLSELKIRVQSSAKTPKNYVDQKTSKKSKAMQRNEGG